MNNATCISLQLLDECFGESKKGDQENLLYSDIGSFPHNEKVCKNISICHAKMRLSHQTCNLISYFSSSGSRFLYTLCIAIPADFSIEEKGNRHIQNDIVKSSTYNKHQPSKPFSSIQPILKLDDNGGYSTALKTHTYTKKFGTNEVKKVIVTEAEYTWSLISCVFSADLVGELQ